MRAGARPVQGRQPSRPEGDEQRERPRQVIEARRSSGRADPGRPTADAGADDGEGARRQQRKACMMEAPQYRPWSDLPPELLGLVLKRLPSLADRVRLRAVCHPWRSNSLLQPLPLPFPWLTLPDGTFFSIPGGEVHQMCLPDGARCHGSIDNWLFLMSSDDACTLMNPFSKTTLELPNPLSFWQRIHGEYDPKQLLYKLVVPSPLDISPDSLVAALIKDDDNIGTVCTSQPLIATYSVQGNSVHRFFDAALFDEKLYAVSVFGQLFILELCRNLDSNSTINRVIDSSGDFHGGPECISREVAFTYMVYLVECAGRLLVVKRFIRRLSPSPDDNIFDNTQTPGFVVLEADLHSNPCRWKRISELGGHALFVGQHGSKSLPARECIGSQEDCIYFICDYPHPKYFSSPFRECGVYNIRNGMVMH
nr:F-box protein At2g26160-like [Aegilops tauschii subsp. strangulata]